MYILILFLISIFNWELIVEKLELEMRQDILRNCRIYVHCQQI